MTSSLTSTITTTTTLTTTSTTTLTTPSTGKRKREGDVEEAAKKAKIDSDNSFLNSEAILAKLTSLTENWNKFASTHPQDQAFIQGQVTQLTEIQQSLTDVFQNFQPYQFDTVRILLRAALQNKQLSKIFQHLNEIIKHGDFDRFIKNLNPNQIKDFFNLSLEAVCQESSKEVFSILIQTMHRQQPSLLTDSLFTRKMRAIFYAEKCADLKLTIHSKQDDAQIMTLNINKAYLGAVSSYFYHYFFGDHTCKEKEHLELQLATENLQSLNDVPLTQENVYDVLRYCHTRTIFFRGVQECLAILLLAEKWQIKPLIHICEEYLCQSIEALTDSFEAVCDIADATQCTRLKSTLLEWAASQKLQGKELDKNILKILDEGKDQVAFLDLSFPFSESQFITIPTQFPKLQRIKFKNLRKEELERKISILQKLTSLSGLWLEEIQLTPTSVLTMRGIQQTLKYLKLINCDFEETPVTQHQVIKNSNESMFKFLAQCTHLETLQLHMQTSHHQVSLAQLQGLTKLRIFHFCAEVASSVMLVPRQWTHLKELEWTLGKFEENPARAQPQDRNEQNRQVHDTLWQLGNSYDLKLTTFKSNVIITELHLLQSISVLCWEGKSTTELFLSTAIDFDQQDVNDKEATFNSQATKTLQWNCGGFIPTPPFFNKLINIETLHLKNARLDDAMLAQLQKFPFLHTLHFEEITNLDDDFLASIAKCPWLESLTLTQCHLITDHGLHSLLSSQNLQKVVIQNCKRISEKGTAFIKEWQQMREFGFVPFKKMEALKE